MSDNVTTSAPAKIILFGEHFVVYGSTAISSAIQLRTFCRISLLDDHGAVPTLKLRLFDVFVNVDIGMTSLPKVEGLDPWNAPSNSVSVSAIDAISRAFSDCKHIVSILYLLLSIGGRRLWECPRSMSIEVVSQFKPGIGLGSSAAFHVAVSCALLKIFGHLECTDVPPVDEEGRVLICEDDNLHISDSSLALVNKWAFVGESVTLKSPSGIDNLTCTYGGIVKFSKDNVQLISQFPKLRILIVDSHVTRSTVDLVLRVLKLKDTVPQLFEKLLIMADKISISALKIFHQYLNYSSDKKKNYLEKRIEYLIDINQELLELVGASHESLDRIVKCARSFGIHSKLTGGGGGGCAIVFINSQVSEHTVDLFKSELYRLDFSCYEVEIESNGVLIHPKCPNVFPVVTNE